MAGPTELFSVVTKFLNLWHLGNDAKLFATTKNGLATVKLHVNLGQCPPPPHYPRAQSRSVGPSRARRSARRAETRRVAAEKAAAQAASGPEIDSAVQAEALANNHTEADKASIADQSNTNYSDAVEVHLQTANAHDAKVVPAGQKQHAGQVCDVLCPDQAFYTAVNAGPPPPFLTNRTMPVMAHAHPVSPQISSQVPQLDGIADDETVSDETLSCKCCEYQKFFQTEEALKQHHDEEHDEYEECNWCYPWHVWIEQKPP